MFRSTTLGALRPAHIGSSVTLSGWVHSQRDHGGIIFIDLRDRYGVTQVVIDPAIVGAEGAAVAARARGEWILRIEGTVRARPEGTVNANLPTGGIEVAATSVSVVSESETPPFPLDSDGEVREDLRLTYRYLDLRRQKMQEYIKLRSDFTFFVRDWFRKHQFIEVETPILTASSPEGARDYLVPSRVHQGKFFALPQAPQQYKQLLMVAGMDRYFQIAPCFRDEDARADRSPGEFYQIDVETSFLAQDEFFALVEPFFTDMALSFAPHKQVLHHPFPRIPYREIMQRMGADKADLRFGLEMVDVTDLAADSGFGVFAKAPVVRALRVPKHLGELTRKDIDELTAIAQDMGAGGLAWLRVGEESGPVAKNATPAFLQAVSQRTATAQRLFDHGEQWADGDVIFFGAGSKSVVEKSMAAVRSSLGDRLGLKDPNVLAFAWVVDFPMYEWLEDEKKWDFAHNPFSEPKGGAAAFTTENPGDMLAYQYDIIANGLELSSGAVRNRDPEALITAFGIAGYSREDVEAKFGHMLRAFRYGAPPHCGFAPGLDRLIMLLTGESNIRNIIAFPKSGKCEDLTMGAPGNVYQHQLDELGLIIKPSKKD